jgi:formylglycine-generating enzyme required for sulfatase activity
MKIHKIIVNILISLCLLFLRKDLKCQSAKEDIFLNNNSQIKAYPLRVNGIIMDFIRIPEGEFMMGSDDRKDE